MNFIRSNPGDDPIIVESYFAASPAKVFQAWTDPEIIVKWFGINPNSLHSANIDLRKGGAWSFVLVKSPEKSVEFKGEYHDIQKDEKLVFSWSHVVTLASGEKDATPFSKVAVIFSPNGTGTDVHLTHSAIVNDDARRGVGSGWNASFQSLMDIL